jgi:hypothetical protein
MRLNYLVDIVDKKKVLNILVIYIDLYFIRLLKHKYFFYYLLNSGIDETYFFGYNMDIRKGKFLIVYNYIDKVFLRALFLCSNIIFFLCF